MTGITYTDKYTKFPLFQIEKGEIKLECGCFIA